MSCSIAGYISIVAAPSFNHKLFQVVIDTRSPNHMCATSWARIALVRNLIARYLLKLIKLMNNVISFFGFFFSIQQFHFIKFEWKIFTFTKLRASTILHCCCKIWILHLSRNSNIKNVATWKTVNWWTNYSDVLSFKVRSVPQVTWWVWLGLAKCPCPCRTCLLWSLSGPSSPSLLSQSRAAEPRLVSGGGTLDPDSSRKTPHSAEITRWVTSRYVTLLHATSFYVTSRHVTSCYFMQRTSHYVTRYQPLLWGNVVSTLCEIAMLFRYFDLVQ